jgi:hypothetical protein
MFASLGALFTWRHRLAGWPLISLGVLFLLASIFGPPLLRFVHRPWMMLARFLGTITSSILLTLVFFLIVTPLGLLQRLFGKSALEFGFHQDRSSYWKARVGGPASEEYERQF